MMFNQCAQKNYTINTCNQAKYVVHLYSWQLKKSK